MNDQLYRIKPLAKLRVVATAIWGLSHLVVLIGLAVSLTRNDWRGPAIICAGFLTMVASLKVVIWVAMRQAHYRARVEQMLEPVKEGAER